jgi:DNA-binding transcriptional ArsR family regulator
MTGDNIHDVMAASPRQTVSVVARPALELLIGLAAAVAPDKQHAETWATPPDWSPELAAAVSACGERSGELWLHLLGPALDLPPTDARAFVDALDGLDAVELRRHLVGVYVPAWVSLVGAETLERGAAGERDAVEALLDHPRYYAGRARESLETLLGVPPEETKARLLAALRLFAEEVLAPIEDELMASLTAEAEGTRRRAAVLSARDLIAEATQGYLYDAEPEFERIVLVPHVAARPLLLLCQHRDARIICYPLTEDRPDPEAALADRAIALGRAIGDAKRVRILRRLAAGDATLDELATETGLAKSTTHHHLTHLRVAGIVGLRGNARAYWYALRPEGLAEAQRTVGALEQPPR